MAYTHSNFFELRQALATRLQDSSNIYWKDAELGLYITEALRTFNSLTNFQRRRGTFASTANVAFYDLPTSLKAGTDSLLNYNVKDTDVVTLMAYHLLEKVPTGLGTSSAAWAGTAMFTLPLFVNALERRRNAFLASTGCVLTQAMQNIPPAAVGRVQLSDNVIAVRRAAWKDVSGTPYAPLWVSDAWGSTAFSQGWSTNPGRPLSYSIIEDQPLEIQLMPVPDSVGQLDLMTVNTGATLDVTTGVLLGVPDDWSWVVKWGAMADLLAADGEAHDQARSEYSEARYQEGVEMCRASEVILQAELQGNPVTVSSLADFDAFIPQWQEVSSAPTGIAAAGRNLVALGPIPDANGPYSVTFDVVQNFPVPVGGADFIQIGREDIEAILGYAQHLSLFKSGAKEVADSLYLYQNFIRHAVQFNERILAQSRFLPALASQSRKEETHRPYREVSA